MADPRVIVIGAGMGGLAAAAALARQGFDVTVLEAHVYPGGCAGTFFHRNYRFDAGATLSGGFYDGGPMALVADAAGIQEWPGSDESPDHPVMSVHLPGGVTVDRWAGERRHAEHADKLGAGALDFFRWQERTADRLWDFALRLPSWPPRSGREAIGLAKDGLGWAAADLKRLSPAVLRDAFRPASAFLEPGNERLRQFVDAQLLISAQTTSKHANAWYAASALDLPRRGIMHPAGGIGALAKTLADAVERSGGRVLYRQEVTAINRVSNDRWQVSTRRSGIHEADHVVANLTPWNIQRLMGSDAPPALRRLPAAPPATWGAFMLYVGLEARALKGITGLHHQMVAGEPLGEGNSVFLSISPAWDASRAPAGRRAVTISTHTRLDAWWRLFEQDRDAYEKRKSAYVGLVLERAEAVIPGLRDAAELVLPGTPVTFQRFTRRERGWVGGFPATGLFHYRQPRLAPGLWMVGDSIFPGQSVAAVSMGGLRVASSVMHEAGVSTSVPAGQILPGEPARFTG